MFDWIQNTPLALTIITTVFSIYPETMNVLCFYKKVEFLRLLYH